MSGTYNMYGGERKCSIILIGNLQERGLGDLAVDGDVIVK